MENRNGMKENKDKTIVFRLTSSLNEKITMYAQKQKISVSKWLHHTIEDHIAETEKANLPLAYREDPKESSEGFGIVSIVILISCVVFYSMKRLWRKS